MGHDVGNSIVSQPPGPGVDVASWHPSINLINNKFIVEVGGA